MVYSVSAIFFLLTLGVGIYSRFIFSILSIFALLNGWRLVSSSYINSLGFAEAPEMERIIVSIFPVDLVMLLTMLMFLFAFLIFFTPRDLNVLKWKLQRSMGKKKKINLIALFVVFSLSYILFILLTGVFTAPLSDYPIVSGIHRREFIIRYGNGELITLFFKTMTYATAFLGIGQFFFIEKCSLKKWYSWMPLVAWLMMYLFLIAQGHRFSTLLWNIYFFYLPLSLLFLSKKEKMAERFFFSLGGLFVAAVVLMFTHSFVVGGFHSTEKASYLTQRILVDQSQMWNLSASRVFGFSNTDEIQAEGVILEPFFADSMYNRSAQFLMYKEMGSKAYESWEQSHLITMGFPESILDLVGEGPVYLWVLFLSCFLCYLFRNLFYFLSEFKVFQCILLLYLVNPVIYLFVGGTANALFSLSYIAKCFAVLLVITVMDYLSRGTLPEWIDYISQSLDLHKKTIN